MRKLRLNFSIDWKSKIVELLIVIIGITVAFKLDNWNESRKSNSKANIYIESFYEENSTNYKNLSAALEFSESNKNDIDTLIQILLSKEYADSRIIDLTSSMMGLANFSPLITTMENISASGDFDLIGDIELRKNLISTYNLYKTTSKLETLLSNYVDKYVTLFFMNNVRFSNFSSLKSDHIKNPQFENIVIGYQVLLNQQIEAYKNNLEALRALNEKLSAAIAKI